MFFPGTVHIILPIGQIIREEGEEAINGFFPSVWKSYPKFLGLVEIVLITKRLVNLFPNFWNSKKFNNIQILWQLFFNPERNIRKIFLQGGREKNICILQKKKHTPLVSVRLCWVAICVFHLNPQPSVLAVQRRIFGCGLVNSFY